MSRSTISLLLLVLLASASVCQEHLLIFVPGITQIRPIQSYFDSLAGNDKTRVFGRVIDLENAMKVTPHASLIVPAELITYLSGYHATLFGTVRNIRGERYLIVTPAPEVTLKNLSEKKVGVLNFLGRDRLNQFIKKQFGILPMTLKYVNKNEDLLTLIGLEMVDAIIISESHYSELLSNTKMKFSIIATSDDLIGYPVYATKSEHKDSRITTILLDPKSMLNKWLQIDAWEKK